MIKKILLILSTLAGIISIYFFYVFYLKIKFNSEGLSFDPLEGVTYNENAFVWGILALVFFAPVVFRLFIRK